MITFTHYEPPNREVSIIHINCDPAVEDMWQALCKAGFHVESEHLRQVGKASLTVGDDEGDYVYQLEPAAFGNEEHLVRAAIEKLVRTAYEKLLAGTLKR